MLQTAATKGIPHGWNLIDPSPWDGLLLGHGWMLCQILYTVTNT